MAQKEGKEKSGRIAAFFDLDGTLVKPPSLERRFFSALRSRRDIPFANYWFWLGESLRLLPRGLRAMAHANKSYLRAVTVLDGPDRGEAEGQAAATLAHLAPRNPRCPLPRFFEAALERAAWHASCGHAIVIISGTLAPLAKAVAQELAERFASQGLAIKIPVLATRLEESHGKWTGRILGEAMFGEAKARAVRKLAEQMHLRLPQCYAYGDSAQDQAMLTSVGNPVAVNASRALARIAKKRGWLALDWKKEERLAATFPSKPPAPRENPHIFPKNELAKAERWI